MFALTLPSRLANFCSAIRATLGQRQIRQSPGLPLNAHSGNDWGSIPVLTGLGLALVSWAFSRVGVHRPSSSIGLSRCFLFTLLHQPLDFIRLFFTVAVSAPHTNPPPYSRLGTGTMLIGYPKRLRYMYLGGGVTSSKA